jgi:hypothetical protein
VANQYLKKTTLYVEGRDDLYSIADLLKKHAFQMDQSPRDVEIHPAALDDKGFGRSKLLELVGPAVKASTDKAIGFIIDADVSASDTWNAVCDQISKAAGPKLKVPKKCPSTGFVANIIALKSRVGVWIMPDNTAKGILEDFLKRLVKSDDKIITVAEFSTDAAKKAGATFKDIAKSKAIIHAWLAWQADPGCPFGTAIKSNYFDYEATSAQAFIKWVRQLVD